MQPPTSSRYASKLNVSLAADPARGVEVSEEAAPSDAALTPEQLASDVQRTQEKLAALKREQEHLERRKRELEDLARRQSEVETNTSDLTERLTRALVVLQQQCLDARRRAEQLEQAGGSLQRHLDGLQGIDVSAWSQSDAPRELTRALGLLDAARADYDGVRARLLNDETDPETSPTAAGARGESERTFVGWLQAGFAFTLPLLVVCLLILLALVFRSSSTP
ncbi:MAG: hypothetical protein JSR82_03820 [Verrucomicrobia bacterium]|nr:hypothetical protein [Verrucomicrobiota bacterium]